MHNFTFMHTSHNIYILWADETLIDFCLFPYLPDHDIPLKLTVYLSNSVSWDRSVGGKGKKIPKT